MQVVAICFLYLHFDLILYLCIQEVQRYRIIKLGCLRGNAGN